MMRLFDRYYSHFLRFGLIAVVWFAAWNRAAYDVWAASTVFAAVTFFVVVFCVGRLRDKKPVRLPLLPHLALCLTALWLTTWHSFDLFATWLEFWGWVFTVAIFYLFTNVADTRPQAESFLSLCGAIVVPLAVVCLWQQITLSPEGYAQIGPFRYGHWEIPGTLVNSVVLAGFILYWPLVYWKRVRQSPLYLAVLLACLLILALARSSLAIAALGLSAVLYNHARILSLARSHQKATRVAVMVVVGIVLTAFYVKFFHRPVGLESTASYHAGSRFFYWQSTIRMFLHEPLSGVGLGGFSIAYPYFKSGPVESTALAHSFPLQILAETGIAGLAAFLILGVSFLRRRLQKDPKTGLRSPLTPLDCTLIAVLFYSFITIHMDYLLNRIVFIIFLAAILADLQHVKIQARPLWTAATGLCALLLVPFWMSLPTANRLYSAGLAYEKKFTLGIDPGSDRYPGFDIGLRGGVRPNRLMPAPAPELGKPSSPEISGQKMDLEKAISLYQKVLMVAPFHAESSWRLSRIYQVRFETTRSPSDENAAEGYRQQAFRSKKDLRFTER